MIVGLGPVWLRWAHFGPFQCEMDGPVETVVNSTPFASGRHVKNFTLGLLEEIL